MFIIKFGKNFDQTSNSSNLVARNIEYFVSRLRLLQFNTAQLITIIINSEYNTKL